MASAGSLVLCLLQSPLHTYHSLYFSVLLPLPVSALPCQGAQSSPAAWEGGARIPVLQSKTDLVQVTHPLCSNERLPRRFWKASLFQACPLLLRLKSLRDSEILTGMGWLCFFIVSAYFHPLAASSCPGLERKAARRRLILCCPAASRHSRSL